MLVIFAIILQINPSAQMQYKKVQLQQLLAAKQNCSVIDVRSPKEYEKGHIPGAISLPLFSNEERHKIGLLYKKKGNKAATRLGLEFVGPKLIDYINKAERIAQNKPLFIYCWRGGMRSNSMALLLATAGLDVSVLIKGYKTYRTWALQQFDINYKLINIGGFTGTGKTILLEKLAKQNEQIINLEEMACHKGSTFGNLPEDPQPTNEQFENNLALLLSSLNHEKPIFTEDENPNLGNVNLPHAFYHQLQRAPLLLINKSRAARINILTSEYANENKEYAIAAFVRIKKRLGGQNLKDATEAIENDDAEKAISIALDYYDKYYYRGLEKRLFTRMVKINDEEDEHILSKLTQLSRDIYG